MYRYYYMLYSHDSVLQEEAQEYFKKALDIDSTQINAKINLELSIQKASAEKMQTNTPEIQSTPAQTDDEPVPTMQEAVFERIKENDENKWKNSSQPQNQASSEDY